MLELIPKQIHRSLFKHIKANYTLTDIFIEGDPQRDQKPPYIEVRMDGPWMQFHDEGEVYCEFEANILIQVNAESNLYLISEIGGQLFKTLGSDITIIDLNNQPLACATIITDRRRTMELNRFGLIDPQSELMHATVEARFGVTLEM